MKTQKESTLHSKLRLICKKHTIAGLEKTEYGGEPTKYDLYPYAPYVPKNWNRILVLAESQQLRGKNEGNIDYVKSLLNASYEDLIFRLGNIRITGEKPEEQVGITPWDEGFIKLAMLSCFPEYKSNQYAVSNAVPWHLDKGNETQTEFLEQKSITFWKEILAVLKPKYIVCTGVYADDIISDTEYCIERDCQQFHIRSASQLGRVINLFDENDLLERYPEVKNAISSNPQVVEISGMDKRYYVFYAAHAVSKIKLYLNK